MSMSTSMSIVRECPSEHATVVNYANLLVELLRTLSPVNPGLIEVFYGVINKSRVQLYHHDGGGDPPSPAGVVRATTWGAMPVLRDGVEGGYLRIPEYDTTIACADGWGVFFPGSELLHGVTPLNISPGGYRYSVIYGTLPGAKECFTACAGLLPPQSGVSRHGWDTDFIDRFKGVF
jgi:hypothetical protein